MIENDRGSEGAAGTAPGDGATGGASARRPDATAQALALSGDRGPGLSCTDPVCLMKVRLRFMFVDVIENASGLVSSCCDPAPTYDVVGVLHEELVMALAWDGINTSCVDVITAMLLAAEEVSGGQDGIRQTAETAIFLPAERGAQATEDFERRVLEAVAGAVQGEQLADVAPADGDGLTEHDAALLQTEIILRAAVRVHSAITAAIATDADVLDPAVMLRESLGHMLLRVLYGERARS